MEASALSAPVGLSRLTVAGRLLRLRSDEQLVALFRAGHEEAFRVIHDRYRQRLHAYARQMLGGSLPDAEDVLQDVFLRAYHALRVDDRPVSLRAWLYRVAHNRCIDQLRRPAPAPADVLDLNRTPEHDPLAEAQRRDQLRRLVADLHRLPGQQRSALLLREMEGLSYAELAAALDVSVPAIKSLLVRARIGLVQASEARDSACPDIRADLAAAHDGRARLSGVARRHVRECDGCRAYRRGLRTTSRSLAGLHPAGPLTVVAKLLGAGGSAGGGAVTVLGGGATATKVVAVVCCAAVVGGGAAEVRDIAADRAPAQRGAPAAQAAAAPVAAAPPAAARAPDPAPAAAPAARRSRDTAKPAPSRSADEGRPGGATLAPTAAAAMPTEIEMRSGGVAAPEAQAPAAGEPAAHPPAHGDAPGTALGEGLGLPAIGGSGSSGSGEESASQEEASGSASGSASDAGEESQPASEGGAGGAAPGGDSRP